MEQRVCQPAKHQPSIYRIVVLEPLDENSSVWFAGMTVTPETSAGGVTTTALTGPVADQAALRGVLTNIWNLNLTVISVSRIDIS